MNSRQPTAHCGTFTGAQILTQSKPAKEPQLPTQELTTSTSNIK